MKKDTIVVTGGAGFVGSNLIILLLKKTKFKIISIDNYSSGLTNNHINNNRVKYFKGDTRDIAKLLKKSKNLDSIFHFGEFARIYQSFINKRKLMNCQIKFVPKILNIYIYAWNDLLINKIKQNKVYC